MIGLGARPFDGKVVVVTGAGQGIGRATALLAAQRGAAVGLCDTQEAAGSQTAELIRQLGGRAVFMAVDVSEPPAVQSFVGRVGDELGRIDVLINNAGISGDRGDVDELAESAWDRVLGVNLNGHFLCCKYIVPYMRRVGGGAIVNTSSVLAKATLPGGLAYTTSKAAIIGFTNVLANQLGPAGIRVNCILPGSTDTPMMWQGLSDAELPAIQAEVSVAQPLKRYGTPAEIAQVALFLASDEASFVTGAALLVDGGLLTRIATSR